MDVESLSTSKHLNTDGGQVSQSTWVDLVKWYVGSLNYGTVQVVVHDSRVIQIEKTERVRLEKGGAPVKSSKP